MTGKIIDQTGLNPSIRAEIVKELEKMKDNVNQLMQSAIEMPIFRSFCKVQA